MKIWRIRIATPRTLPDPETNFPDDFRAETPFQFPQDFRLGNLFELVMQRRLQDPHKKHTRAKADWRRMRRDKVPDNLFPCIHYFRFADAFAEPELFHQLR